MVRCFSDRPSHIGALLTEAVARAPDAVALVAGDQRISYAELAHLVGQAAAGLIGAALQPGERVGLLIGNRPEFLVALLAAERAGLVAVPMNVRQRRPEVAYMMQNCEAVALIYDVECIEAVPDRRETPGLRLLCAVGGEPRPGDARLEDLGRNLNDAPPHHPNEDDPFCILYTSGTTGRPKGAVLTHLGCIHSVLHYQHGFGLREREVAVLGVPVSHVTGLIAISLLMLRLAGTTVVMASFRAKQFLEIAQRERATFTLMVPAMYKLCLLVPDIADHDLSAWRVGGFGGEQMPAATIAELSAAIPSLKLSNIYGATETSSPATILAPGFPEEQRLSVGRALPCVEMVIVGSDGREVATGDHGELLIGGPTVVPCYWNNLAANEAAFGGGYWRSGDVGSIDEDGLVYVHDRIKDMLNRGGYKVYCAEVENVVMHYPGVRECAVVGVPDPVLGERVHAIVVADAIDADMLRQWCAERLSDYKVPEFVTRLDAGLPRNAAGKVLKNELRQLQP